MNKFDEAIKIVLINEGGYIDHPSDKGRCTSYGISLRFAQSMNTTLTCNDIREMTREHAIEIYREFYWEPNRYNEIECDIIATKILDMSINMGANAANKALQTACNNLGSDLVVDGVCGSKTITAANSHSSVALITQLRILMREFYQNLVMNDKSQGIFISGWMRRADW